MRKEAKYGRIRSTRCSGDVHICLGFYTNLSRFQERDNHRKEISVNDVVYFEYLDALDLSALWKLASAKLDQVVLCHVFSLFYAPAVSKVMMKRGVEPHTPLSYHNVISDYGVGTSSTYLNGGIDVLT